MVGDNSLCCQQNMMTFDWWCHVSCSQIGKSWYTPEIDYTGNTLRYHILWQKLCRSLAKSAQIWLILSDRTDEFRELLILGWYVTSYSHRQECNTKTPFQYFYPKSNVTNVLFNLCTVQCIVHNKRNTCPHDLCHYIGHLRAMLTKPDEVFQVCPPSTPKQN